MQLPLASRLLAILATTALALTLAGPVTPAFTQGAPPPPPAGKRTPPTAALPKSPVERDRVLADQYALLATAEDESTAKAIADGIERVWLHSGSPTVDLLFGRAMKAVQAKDYDLALKLFDNVVEQAPDFTEGWNRRAFVHFQKNELALALGDLRRALALDHNHFKALDGLSQLLREIGQKKAALEVMRRLYEVHPYWPGAVQVLEELSREVEGQGI
jgi:tetratricopeptide (TPR) repeat protein